MGSRLAGNARFAWVTFGLLVIALFLVPDLSRADSPQESPRLGAKQALKVYVSLPRQGDNAGTSKLIARGLNAAVRSVGGKVGGRSVRLVQLDDSRGPRWQAGLVRKNARQAVADPGAVAYVGELNSEATAIAKPILARAGMPMFAPIATADPLTPELDSLLTAKRPPNLFRTIPNDAAQAAALVTYLKRSKVRRAVVVDDGALYGRGLAGDVVREARERKVRLVGRFRAHPDGKGRRSLIRHIATKRPQAIVFTGSLSSGAVPLFKALNRALPKALLFGGDALAHNSFARRVGPARSMVRLTRPAAHINPKNRRLRKLLGRRPDSVTVFAFDGMMALLRAIRRSKAGELPTPGERRAAVREDLFAGHFQKGAVSTWVVLPNGDSSNGVFDAIRLGKNRVIEPIEIAVRRQTKRSRGTQKGTRARSSSIWAEISGNPNLTTFGDLESLIASYPESWDAYLEHLLVEVSKRVEELKAEGEDLRELYLALDYLKGFFGSWPSSTLGESSRTAFQIRNAAANLLSKKAYPRVQSYLPAGSPNSWRRIDFDRAWNWQQYLRMKHADRLKEMLMVEQSLINRRNELHEMETFSEG